MKISEGAAISILARYYAKQGVKAELWAQGRKVREFSACDIAKAAQVYLDQHRAELIAKAESVWSKLESHAQQRKR